ncbi:MAG: PDZ domain-containing protein [Chloroflexales bacterium]|nr:PDZ domain-containing protein [Chloroflexales bacterium]
MKRHPRAIIGALALLLAMALAACGAPPPQAPAEYLTNALDWVEAHAALHDRVADWPALRAEALALAPHPATIADTYPAIRHVLAAINAAGDRNAFLVDPGILGAGVRSFGSHELRGDGTIVFLEPGGPAARAGLQVGDQIIQVDGVAYADYAATRANLPLPASSHFIIRRPGEPTPREVTLQSAQVSYEGKPSGRRIDAGGAGVGYLALPWDWGSHLYPSPRPAAGSWTCARTPAGICGPSSPRWAPSSARATWAALSTAMGTARAGATRTARCAGTTACAARARLMARSTPWRPARWRC